MSPFQGLGEGATAFPGLRPGLSYLAPSGLRSDPPAQRSRRRQRAPHASRDGLAFSHLEACCLQLPPCGSALAARGSQLEACSLQLAACSFPLAARRSQLAARSLRLAACSLRLAASPLRLGA